MQRELLEALVPNPVESPKPTSDLEYVQAAAREFLHREGEFTPPATLTPETTLTAGELEALRDVGLATEPDTERLAAQARQETLYAFFHVFKSALPTQEVAALLGVNPSRIRQRVKERSLLALTDGNEHRFPSIQFHRQTELPGLRLVLPALRESMNTLAAVSWLSTPTPDLATIGANDELGEPLSPREYLLRTGDAKRVAEIAAWPRQA